MSPEAFYFFLFLAIAAGGFIVAMVGMFLAAITESVGVAFATNCLAGLAIVVGKLGALIAGIVWIVRQFSP